MKAKLIKTRDDGFLTYVLKGEDKRTIAMTKYPFPSESVYLAESHGIKLQKLSPENCDEIFGVFDVEKLAKEVLPNDDTTGTLSKQKGFVIGFNKAMELNKDKVFTLEDMRTAMTYGIVQEGTGFEGIHSVDDLFNLILKKVSQPTEIEVMVEMEVADLAFYENGERHPIKANLPERFKYKPKLDSDGCLILKRYEA